MIKKIIALLLCMAGAAAWIVVNQTQEKEVFRQDEEPLLDRVVVLDAGHGGIDGGVVGITTKTREASVNLSVTKKLAVLLESAGIKVVMTRTGEASLCADRYLYQKAGYAASRRGDRRGQAGYDYQHPHEFLSGSVRSRSAVFFLSGLGGRRAACRRDAGEPAQVCRLLQ